jgi:hypothetical protein
MAATGRKRLPVRRQVCQCLGRAAAGPIASLADVPDLAADLLLTHRDRLGALIDVTAGPDALAAQTQSGSMEKLSRACYATAFEADSPLPYPPPWTARLGRPPRGAGDVRD